MNYSAIMKLSSNPPPQDAIDSAEELLINCYSFDYKVKSLDELRAKMASIWVKDRNRKSISGRLPPSTMAFHEHCLRSSRRVKIWFDALEPFPITPALFGNGYDYSSTTNKFKIKWSALNDHPNEYRLQTCGECKGGCTRCNCYKNNLSCTVFCRCHQDLCCNRTSYNSSIQQVKIKSNKFELTPSIQQVKINSNKFELTPSSIQNNSFDVTSIQSQSIYESSEGERVFQSPYACSTPKFNGMRNNLTSLNFETRSLTISLTSRRTPHFRKYFRTTKTASQPDLNEIFLFFFNVRSNLSK
ncbi:unnamed protein product [Rotaria sordida]|uniref:Uncharacterized protein n=1 Tax=Rotaria sordida TaxID=392033 RepID=A0A815G8U7_9BILA|nr:unnamed protein product [Rotaria sordida]